MLGSVWPAAGRAAWWGWPLVFSSNFHIKKNKEKKTYKNKNPTSPSCVFCSQSVALSRAHCTPVALEEPSVPPASPLRGSGSHPLLGSAQRWDVQEKSGQQHMAPAGWPGGSPAASPWPHAHHLPQGGRERSIGARGSHTGSRHAMSVRGRGGPGLAWEPDWQVPGSPARAARVAGSAGLLAGLVEPAAAVHRWLPGATGPPGAGVPFPPGDSAQISASPFPETLPRLAPRTPPPGPLDRFIQARCRREGSPRLPEGGSPQGHRREGSPRPSEGGVPKAPRGRGPQDRRREGSPRPPEGGVPKAAGGAPLPAVPPAPP